MDGCLRWYILTGRCLRVYWERVLKSYFLATLQCAALADARHHGSPVHTSLLTHTVWLFGVFGLFSVQPSQTQPSEGLELSALRPLLPGAPPPEDAVGSGRAGVAGEPGCRDLRAAGVQGEAHATHRPVALEQSDQVGLQLALGFGLRCVWLHRTGGGL